ncbi:glutamate receptor U1-like [Panulirus ornatus]|uniref:glutamate receptor U1-like n=1 Tax=Panulirus ornatus TaxID=150431 RepID=UPI003A8B64BC
MNQLYWGPGVRRINTWYRHRFTRQLDLFPDKVSDLQGAILKVSTFNYEPCNFLHRAENGTVVLRYGVDIEVVIAVARVLNMTLDFTETSNGEMWGEELENGSWYGLMGQLQRHEVDIGLANLFISSHNLQVPDLTSPYRTEMMCFMTRTEPPLPQWQSLAFPFHQWTWLAVLVGLIVSGPLLFLMARASDRCGGELRSLQSLSYSWYYAFGVHFCEAHDSLPRSASTQIFVLFLWLYTMILTMVYSNSLKAFLLVKKQPTMMETIQDLYESGLEVAGLTELYKYEFASSSSPYLQSGTEGEWVLYMNQLYWGPGVRRINTWYHHRFTRQLDLFPDKMADFQGAVLKVSTFTYEPCNVLHRAENGTVVLRYGVDVYLVKAVAQALNITLEFTETENGIFINAICSLGYFSHQ